ncbi:oligosaccharide flippase family protein [Enterococcus casseliflavus]|uniref:oligosaccharide flippase family protein n=1 Tax=Enterococcus casseliflavus TaxID=37734 RepID=UPI002DBF48B2|nr:oligosaccharide flippase family protein [Enterococcus casseliflavus]MEB6145996.1 oligosaccharide flippase family protein [Enterococcus casseliflavus]
MKKVLENFIYQSSYQLLNVLLPIVTVPIVSRALGPEGIGAWNFTNSIVTYFVLVAGLGLSNYAVREIAYVKEDQKSLSKKFIELQMFNMLFSIFVLFVYILFSLNLPNRNLFLIQSLMIVSTILDISWFFQGIEDFKKVAVRNVSIKITALVLIVLLVKNPDDLLIYAGIVSGSTLLSTLILWVSLKKYIRIEKVEFGNVIAHFKPSLNFFLLKLSATLFNNISKTILGIFSGLVAVGLFSSSLTLIIMVGTLIHSMNIVMMPRLSNLFKNEGEDKLIKVFKKVIHFQLYITIPMAFGILATNAQMIIWLFGEQFIFARYIIPILVPVVVIQQLNQAIAHQYLLPKNEMKSYNISMVYGTIVNILLCVVLVPFINEFGAALGFLLGQITMCFYRVRLLLLKSKFAFEMKNIILWIISSIVMFIIVYASTSKLSPTIYTTILQSFFGIIIYFSITTFLKINPFWKYLKKFSLREH